MQRCHAGEFAGEHLLGDGAAGGFEEEAGWRGYRFGVTAIVIVVVGGNGGRREEGGFDLGGLTPEGTAEGGGLDEGVARGKG